MSIVYDIEPDIAFTISDIVFDIVSDIEPNNVHPKITVIFRQLAVQTTIGQYCPNCTLGDRWHSFL